MGQRELRRRGIGQHTIEKALHAHVRLNTCRKIVAVMDEYKKENKNLKAARSHVTGWARRDQQEVWNSSSDESTQNPLKAAFPAQMLSNGSMLLQITSAVLDCCLWDGIPTGDGYVWCADRSRLVLSHLSQAHVEIAFRPCLLRPSSPRV